MKAERGRQTWGTISFLVVVCLIALPAQAKYGGGTGTADDPYLIWTAEQMNTIGTDPNDWDKHFKLMANIDLGEYTGEQFNIIGYHYDVRNEIPLTGVFDGNDHAISNFTWTSICRDCVGIFGYVDSPGAEIRNLHIVDANVSAEGGSDVGSLVGSLVSGVLSNCSIHSGTISGTSCVGGLAGVTGRQWLKPDGMPVITYCHAEDRVIGNWAVGGLVGQNFGTIADSDANGGVTGRDIPADAPTCWPNQSIEAAPSMMIGGLVGWNDGTITDCNTNGTVTGSYTAGGLVGMNGRAIARCYTIGDTTGNSRVGNLVGYNYRGTITDCHSTGTVSGAGDVGGLVGAHSGTIHACGGKS